MPAFNRKHPKIQAIPEFFSSYVDLGISLHSAYILSIHAKQGTIYIHTYTLTLIALYLTIYKVHFPAWVFMKGYECE